MCACVVICDSVSMKVYQAVDVNYLGKRVSPPNVYIYIYFFLNYFVHVETVLLNCSNDIKLYVLMGIHA